jgi:Uncharacterized protein conserved in bacteria (DUF2330)
MRIIKCGGDVWGIGANHQFRMLRPFIMLAIMIALAPGVSRAAGISLGARITFERALLISDGVNQQMIVTVDLSEAQPHAAVIFPVPATPTVDQPANGEALLRYVAEVTQPLVDRKSRYVWRTQSRDSRGMVASPTPGVNVIKQQTLGGFTVASLSATDPQALQSWLAANDYTLPAAAVPILKAYVADGWTFVAVKRDADTPEGSLSALRIRYAGTTPVYPMRLGALSDRPVGVDLFVLSAHRSQVANLPTIFAGPMSSLNPPPTSDLAALMAGAPYLTRMRSADLVPASLTSDITIGQAPSDEPYREVITVSQEVALSDYALLGIALCMATFSPIAFVLALSIRRRIERLVPKEL